MKATEVVVEGALTEDGQLVLDEKPNLPPGRVKVLLRPLDRTAPSEGGLLQAVKELQAAQEARGFAGYPVEELLAELDAMRDEWDEDA
jgi:hypothetical protein